MLQWEKTAQEEEVSTRVTEKNTSAAGRPGVERREGG